MLSSIVIALINYFDEILGKMSNKELSDLYDELHKEMQITTKAPEYDLLLGFIWGEAERRNESGFEKWDNESGQPAELWEYLENKK